MVFGAVLAVLIAQLFGKNAETDAFFAAYGFYSVGVTFTYTVRLTAVSRLVGSSAIAVTRQLGAALLIAVAFSVPMLILAAQLGRLLVESDPTGVAAATLRILWPALAGQLLGAMLATILAVRGSFNTIGIATLLTGPVTIATFLLAEPATGIEAAAIGLSAGALWLVAVLAGTLVRAGWRPRRGDLADVRGMAAEALRLTFASATFLGATGAYVACLALAARQGAGEATLFAYAFVLIVTLLGVTSNVLAMVRSPSLVASSERTAEAAASAVWGLRMTLVLAGPALAMVLLVGKPVIGVVLGGEFSDGDIESLLITLVCLVGALVGPAAGIFALVELLARGALVPLAILAAGQVGVAACAAWVGAEIGGIYGIALSLSAVTLAVTLIQIRWAFGAAWRAPVLAMARASGRELAVLTAAFAPPAAVVLLADESAVTTAGAGLLATTLAAVATSVAWPQESRALLALVR
jgi:peptidoglycan biosynthesis protein MviN/MurJ (putative lipid II flippase)